MKPAIIIVYCSMLLCGCTASRVVYNETEIPSKVDYFNNAILKKISANDLLKLTLEQANRVKEDSIKKLNELINEKSDNYTNNYKTDSTFIAKRLPTDAKRLALFSTVRDLDIHYQSLFILLTENIIHQKVLIKKSQNQIRWMAWGGGGTLLAAGVGGVKSSNALTIWSASIGLVTVIFTSIEKNLTYRTIAAVNNNLNLIKKHDLTLTELHNELNTSLIKDDLSSVNFDGWIKKVETEISELKKDFPSENHNFMQ